MSTTSDSNIPNTRCRESRPRDTVGRFWRPVVGRWCTVAWLWSSVACWRFWGPVRRFWGSVGWLWRTVRGFWTVSVSFSAVFKTIQEWNGRFRWSWSAKDVEDSVESRIGVFWKIINGQGLDWIPNRNDLDADFQLRRSILTNFQLKRSILTNFQLRRSILTNSPGLVGHIADWRQESTKNKSWSKFFWIWFMLRRIFYILHFSNWKCMNSFKFGCRCI